VRAGSARAAGQRSSESLICGLLKGREAVGEPHDSPKLRCLWPAIKADAAAIPGCASYPAGRLRDQVRRDALDTEIMPGSGGPLPPWIPPKARCDLSGSPRSRARHLNGRPAARNPADGGRSRPGPPAQPSGAVLSMSTPLPRGYAVDPDTVQADLLSAVTARLSPPTRVPGRAGPTDSCRTLTVWRRCHRDLASLAGKWRALLGERRSRVGLAGSPADRE